MCLMVLDAFQVLHTIFKLIQVLHQSKPLADQSLFISKSLSSRKLTRCYKWDPWINSFVLVKGKDKLGNLKLRICLDPTNLNKAIVHEPYHFKTPQDIAHHLAEACRITVCDCRKGYWHQQLDEASSFLTTFNTEVDRFQ